MRRRRRPGVALPIAGVARHLVAAAAARRTVTYAILARECGGSARGQWRILLALANECSARGVPVLSLLAVNATTRLPTVHGEIYRRLGLVSRGAIRAEQQRCFDYDWRSITFDADR